MARVIARIVHEIGTDGLKPQVTRRSLHSNCDIDDTSYRSILAQEQCSFFVN